MFLIRNSKVVKIVATLLLPLFTLNDVSGALEVNGNRQSISDALMPVSGINPVGEELPGLQEVINSLDISENLQKAFVFKQVCEIIRRVMVHSGTMMTGRGLTRHINAKMPDGVGENSFLGIDWANVAKTKEPPSYRITYSDGDSGKATDIYFIDGSQTDPKSIGAVPLDKGKVWIKCVPGGAGIDYIPSVADGSLPEDKDSPIDITPKDDKKRIGPQTQQPVDPGSEAADKGLIRVLHIEDHDILAEVVQETMSRMSSGFEFRRIKGFDELRAFIENGGLEDVDIIVSDLQIIGGNADSLLVDIKKGKYGERGKRIPCILMTGRPEEVSEAAREDGVLSDILTKPFASKEFKDAVTKAIGTKLMPMGPPSGDLNVENVKKALARMKRVPGMTMTYSITPEGYLVFPNSQEKGFVELAVERTFYYVDRLYLSRHLPREMRESIFKDLKDNISRSKQDPSIGVVENSPFTSLVDVTNNQVLLDKRWTDLFIRFIYHEKYGMKYSEVVLWLLSERLFHEMAHAPTEKEQLIRDIYYHLMLVEDINVGSLYEKVTEEEIEEFFDLPEVRSSGVTDQTRGRFRFIEEQARRIKNGGFIDMDAVDGFLAGYDDIYVSFGGVEYKAMAQSAYEPIVTEKDKKDFADITVIAIDNDPEILEIYRNKFTSVPGWSPDFKAFTSVDAGLVAVEAAREKYRSQGLTSAEIDKKIVVVLDLYLGKSNGNYVKGGVDAANELRVSPGSGLGLDREMDFKGAILILSGSSVSKSQFPNIFKNGVRGHALAYEEKNENGDLGNTALRTVIDLLRHPIPVEDKVTSLLVQKEIPEETESLEVFNDFEVKINSAITEIEEAVLEARVGNSDRIMSILSSTRERLIPSGPHGEGRYHDFNGAVSVVKSADSEGELSYLPGLRKEIDKIRVAHSKAILLEKLSLLEDRIDAAVSFTWHAGEFNASMRMEKDLVTVGKALKDSMRGSRKNLIFNGMVFKGSDHPTQEEVDSMFTSEITGSSVPYPVYYILNAILRNSKEAYEEHEGIKLGLNDKRPVEIKAYREKERLIISVSDEAGGIKDPERVFEARYSTKHPYRGGFGLYFAAELASRNNITLSAAYNSRGGAVFTISFSPDDILVQTLEEDERPQAILPSPPGHIEERHNREAKQLGGKLAQLIRLDRVVRKRGKGRVASFRWIGIEEGWNAVMGLNESDGSDNRAAVEQGDAIVRHFNSLVERVYEDFSDAKDETTAIRRVETLSPLFHVGSMREIFKDNFLSELKDNSGKVTTEKISSYLNDHLEQLAEKIELPSEVEEEILRRIAELSEAVDSSGEKAVSSGIFIARSSGIREDSFEDNMAGGLLSEKFGEGEAAGICRLIYRHALQKAWCDDKLLSAESGAAVIFHNYIKYDTGAVLFTDMYDHATAEVVMGQTESAVSDRPNVTIFERVSGERMEIRQLFRNAPYEIVTKEGKHYCKTEDLAELVGYWVNNSVTSKDFSGKDIRVPVSADKINELLEEAIAISADEDFGYPLDIECGIDEFGGIWFQQSRPVLVGAEREYFDLPEIPEGDKLSVIQAAFGNTGESGFEGRVVVVPKGIVSERDFRGIDEAIGEPYILVCEDIASRPVGKGAYVLLDPLAGSRTAHNINRLSARIKQGDIVYGAGFDMQEAFRTSLEYDKPLQDLPGVRVSKGKVKVWANGLYGVMEYRGAGEKTRRNKLSNNERALVEDMGMYSASYNDIAKNGEEPGEIRRRISSIMNYEYERLAISETYETALSENAYEKLFTLVRTLLIDSYINGVLGRDFIFQTGYTQNIWTDLEHVFDHEKDSSGEWDFVSYRSPGRYGLAADLIQGITPEKYEPLARLFGIIKEEMSTPLYPLYFDSRTVEILEWLSFMADLKEMYESGKLRELVEKENAEREDYLSKNRDLQDSRRQAIQKQVREDKKLASKLPKVTEKPDKDAVKAVASDPGRGVVKILVAEDNELGLNGVVFFLKRKIEGVELIKCGDWDRFFEILSDEEPDIIITDLPEDRSVDGVIAHAESIKRILPGVIVIISSGESHNLGQFPEGLIVDYFQKPWDEDDVKASVRVAVDEIRALRKEAEKSTGSPAEDGEIAGREPLKVVLFDTRTEQYRYLEEELLAGCKNAVRPEEAIFYTADSVDDLCGLISQHQPDIVIMDYFDIDAMDYVIRLADIHNPKVKVIVNSNMSESRVRRDFGDGIVITRKDKGPFEALRKIIDDISVPGESAAEEQLRAPGGSDTAEETGHPAEPATKAEAEVLVSSRNGDSKINVVVFDDDEHLMMGVERGLKTVLADKPVNVRGFSEADKALDWMKVNKPDVMIMDMVPGERNVYAGSVLDRDQENPAGSDSISRTRYFVDMARAVNPSVRIALLTGRSDIDGERDIGTGVVKLTKPVTIEAMGDAVGELVDEVLSREQQIAEPASHNKGHLASLSDVETDGVLLSEDERRLVEKAAGSGGSYKFFNGEEDLKGQLRRRVAGIINYEREKFSSAEYYQDELSEKAYRDLYTLIKGLVLESYVLGVLPHTFRYETAYRHELWDDLFKSFMLEKGTGLKLKYFNRGKYELAAWLVHGLGAEKYKGLEELFGIIKEELGLPFYPGVSDSRAVEILEWLGFMAGLGESYKSGELRKLVDEENAERSVWLYANEANMGDSSVARIAAHIKEAEQFASLLPEAEPELHRISEDHGRHEEQYGTLDGVRQGQAAKFKVLFYDNDQGIFDILERALGDEGDIEAVGTSSASSIVGLIERERPDLIIMDIIDPEVLERIIFKAKTENPDVTIRVYTGKVLEREDLSIFEKYDRVIYDKKGGGNLPHEYVPMVVDELREQITKKVDAGLTSEPGDLAGDILSTKGPQDTVLPGEGKGTDQVDTDLGTGMLEAPKEKGILLYIQDQSTARKNIEEGIPYYHPDSGLSVIAAADIAEARKLLDEGLVPSIFMIDPTAADGEIPSDFYRIVKEMKDKYPDMPVIVRTVGDNFMIKAELNGHGVDAESVHYILYVMPLEEECQDIMEIWDAVKERRIKSVQAVQETKVDAQIDNGKRVPVQRRVLVIDDQRAARSRFRQALVSAGCEVLTAASGREAIDRYFRDDDRGITHIVLDLELAPGEENLPFEIMKAARDRNISITIVSGTPDIEGTRKQYGGLLGGYPVRVFSKTSSVYGLVAGEIAGEGAEEEDRAPAEIYDLVIMKEDISASLVDTMASKAVNASGRGKKIMIGFADDWMPYMENGMQVLLQAVLRISEPSGISDVIIVRGSSSNADPDRDLSEILKKRAAVEGIAYSDILVLGGLDVTRDDGHWEAMEDPEDRSKPFRVGVDDVNIRREPSPGKAFNCFLPEMMRAAVELAFSEKEIKNIHIEGVLARILRPGVWAFIPDADEIDVEELYFSHTTLASDIDTAL